jgi:hypothetical protein
MNIEPPQDVIVEEDEGPCISYSQPEDITTTQQTLINRKEANTVKYLR